MERQDDVFGLRAKVKGKRDIEKRDEKVIGQDILKEESSLKKFGRRLKAFGQKG